MPLRGWRIDLVEGSSQAVTKGISQVQLSHRSSAVSAVFDEPTLVSAAGLVPVLAVAERASCAGWPTSGLARRHPSIEPRFLLDHSRHC